MKNMILGLLFIYSVNILEASEITIGYNPADFIISGKSLPGVALTDIVVTGLNNARCPNYTVVGSEDPRTMEAIEKETELSSSEYADPAGRLTPNIIVATDLLKGNASFEDGKVSINLRIEDRKGCIRAEAKVSGSEDNFYELIEKATKSLGHQLCMPNPNIQTCSNYYTVTISQKTTSKVKPLEQYRGISKTLKSFEEDKDVYYIYVDVDKAKIEQYHINKLSTRKIHKEAYEFNTKSCKYEVKSEDKVVKNKGGPHICKSEDAGWGFEDDTMIYVTPPYSDKQLSFTWGRLRENGSYHASGKYKKEIPKLVKELMGKVNGMATTYRNETQTDPIMQFFISTTYLTPPDEGCAGRVSMESFIPPLDGFIDPDVEYKIDIRRSRKSEKKIMKRFLNNEVGNPEDFIRKGLEKFQEEFKKNNTLQHEGGVGGK